MCLDKYPWLLKHYAYTNQLLKGEQMHHTLMLCGPNGIGKAVLANHLAKTLLACPIEKLEVHADFYSVVPHSNNNVISIDQVRELFSNLTKSTHQGLYKVVVINRIEQANIYALNALLKILEEPPKNTYFILLAQSISLINPTILSRCFIYKLPAVESQMTLDFLRKNELPERLLPFLDGGPLKAIRYQSMDFINQVELFWTLSSAYFEGELPTDKLTHSIDKLSYPLCLDLLIILIQKAIHSACKANVSTLLVDMPELVKTLACLRRCSKSQLISAYDKLLQLKALHAEPKFLNTQLAIESVFIMLYRQINA